MKWLKGRRTQIVGSLIAVCGLLEQYTREIIPLEYQGWTLFVVGLVMIILRQITTTPVGKNE